ncbi:MAG: sulfotransferase domain-containing protein [Planctomycetaceae bacterium]
MITVVSGLPRSGTSLVMQMLAAGGHPVLADEQRPADADNPKGYLEFDKVRALERDASWMADAEGKAVKIISFLLPRLPSGFAYRIIFLRRDLEEVIRSQEVMLQRRGQPPGPDAQVMKSHFERHLKTIDNWLASHPEISVLNCAYADLIGDPQAGTAAIAQFLDCGLDIAKMRQTVDPALYRQRG